MKTHFFFNFCLTDFSSFDSLLLSYLWLFFSIDYRFVESGSLEKLLKKFGVFPESLVALYVSQVLFGLKYLHNMGIVHRDIKVHTHTLSDFNFQFCVFFPFESALECSSRIWEEMCWCVDVLMCCCFHLMLEGWKYFDHKKGIGQISGLWNSTLVGWFVENSDSRRHTLLEYVPFDILLYNKKNCFVFIAFCWSLTTFICCFLCSNAILL